MKHEKYDTSKVKTITLNGKKYIDMSVIEDIKAEIEKERKSVFVTVEEDDCLEMVLEIIDQAIKECDT